MASPSPPASASSSAAKKAGAGGADTSTTAALGPAKSKLSDKKRAAKLRSVEMEKRELKGMMAALQKIQDINKMSTQMQAERGKMLHLQQTLNSSLKQVDGQLNEALKVRNQID